MNPLRALAIPALLIAALYGCGGGGGGNSTVAESPLPAGQPQPNQTVSLPGISRSASGTASESGVVSSLTLNSVDTTTSSASQTYGASGELTGMSFSSPQSNVSYTGSQINCADEFVCTGETSTSTAIVSKASALGWSYQSFGVWLNETGPTTFDFGALSAGSVTPGTAVPTSGSATFTGLANGFYVDPSGVPFFTSADMTATVNWNSRSIGFSTANTMAGNLNTDAAPAANSNLNMNGTLSYGAGSSQFSGSVSASGAGLNGSATGRFYGPNAEEMGGVYGLTGSGPSRMIGAFGAKR